MKSKITALLPPLVWLLAGLAALALFRIFRKDPAAMQWWLGHVSMPYKQAMSAWADKVSFSVAEAVCTLAGAAVMALAANTVWRMAHGAAVNWAGRLLGICAFGVWVYAAVCAFWGTQYYGESFARKTGLQARCRWRSCARSPCGSATG